MRFLTAFVFSVGIPQRVHSSLSGTRKKRNASCLSQDRNRSPEQKNVPRPHLRMRYHELTDNTLRQFFSPIVFINNAKQNSEAGRWLQMLTVPRLSIAKLAATGRSGSFIYSDVITTYHFVVFGTIQEDAHLLPCVILQIFFSNVYRSIISGKT